MLELEWVRKVIFVILVLPPIYIGATLKRDGKKNGLDRKIKFGKIMHIITIITVFGLIIADNYAISNKMSAYCVVLVALVVINIAMYILTYLLIDPLRFKK